jgi:hypothetical protein
VNLYNHTLSSVGKLLRWLAAAAAEQETQQRPPTGHTAPNTKQLRPVLVPAGMCTNYQPAVNHKLPFRAKAAGDAFPAALHAHW